MSHIQRSEVCPGAPGSNNQCPSAHLGSNGQTDFWVPRVSAISGRISFLARWGGPPRRARGNALSGLRGYEKGFSGGMVRTLSVKSVQSLVTPVGLMAVEITLQELNYRSGARTYLEVLLNGPPRRARGKLSKRMTRIRGKAINNDSRRSGVESGYQKRRKKKPTAKKRKDAKNCSGKYFVFVALGPCGETRFYSQGGNRGGRRIPSNDAY